MFLVKNFQESQSKMPQLPVYCTVKFLAQNSMIPNSQIYILGNVPLCIIVYVANCMEWAQNDAKSVSYVMRRDRMDEHERKYMLNFGKCCWCWERMREMETEQERAVGKGGRRRGGGRCAIWRNKSTRRGEMKERERGWTSFETHRHL